MADLADMKVPAVPASPRGRFWSDVREALRGSEQDYTQGPIGRAILLLAVPMVLEMAMESVFAVADVFFVGRLGPDAVAAVGLTESMLTLVYALAMGLGIGTTAIVARRIGEKDREGAARAAVQAIALGVAGAVFLGGLGVAFAPRLLALMGASPAVLRIGSGYTRVMLGGEATIVVLFVVNAVFRGAGDAAIAMRVLWLANAINIVLGPCFIFGLGPFPELGVTGAAVATNIGRGIGVAYQLHSLMRGKRLAVQRRHVRFDWVKMVGLLRIASTASFQTLIETASWLGLVRILARFGSSALAGYTIAIRVAIFALLPSWGMANAAATLVGQNLGAKRPDRAERSVWIAGLYNFLFLGSVGVVFAVLTEPIVHTFTTEPDVVPYAIDCLRIVSLGFVFFAYGMVMIQSFNGAGD